MPHTAPVKEPKTLAGLVLIVFGAWLILEGAFMRCTAQVAIAVVFTGVGLWMRHLGIRTHNISTLGRKWARFTALALPVLLIVYVAGYFVLMDRHRPTHPAGEYIRFDSSLRWAPREWIDRAVPPYETPWGSVTTWNILYRPMDRLWFHFFPRSKDELERLRSLGYYN